MMKNSILLLLTFSLLSALVLCCRDNESPEDILKRKMLIEINKIRLSGCNCGDDTIPPINPIAWDESLTIAAKRHTLDMSINNFLNHAGTDGSSPAVRANEAGFEGIYIGENIAWGYSTVEDLVEAWKNSPPHCKTIMNYRFEYMGASTMDYYWTLVLGGE